MKTIVMMLATAIGLLLSSSLLQADEPVTPTSHLGDIVPVNRFGVCSHMRWRERGWKFEELIPIMKRMGVSTVRDELSWHNTETVKGQYALDPREEAWIKAVTAADIKVILMVGYGNGRYDNSLDPQAYAAFTAWLAAHFKGNSNILAFELWNEPGNFSFKTKYGGEWNGKNDAPWLGKFAELVGKAAAAIKQVDPDRTVITGGGNAAASMHMLDRYPNAFTHVDGLTLHPYSFRLPPEIVPWGGKGITKRDGIPTAGDDHTMISLWETLEAKMTEKLGKKIGIWVTEVGYTTFNHTLKTGLYAGYTEPVQAAYLTRSLVAALAWPNIKTYCLYDLMNDGTNPAINEDNFGMVRFISEGLAPKNSFYALRRMAQQLGGYYQFIDNPPVQIQSKSLELDENDVWKKRPVDSYITDTSAKVYWFKTDKGYVTFVWRAGRNNGEHNPPLGNFPVVVVPSDTKISITDLVTGQIMDHLAKRVGNDVTINNLPLQGYPIAITWHTGGELKPLVAATAGDEVLLPVTDARGKWKFTNGPEFKGATGSIDIPKVDDQPLTIKYDFSAGGYYVAAIKNLDPKLNISTLSMKISGDSPYINMRLIDKTGQVFQYKLGKPDKNGILQLDMLKTKASGSWGGAKDYKIHPPLSSIWILVDNQDPQKRVGAVDIHNIQIKVGQTPAE